MKNKKFFAIVTLVCFLFTLMPVAAFASDAGSVYLAGQQITSSGNYVQKEDGTWTTTESAVSYVGVDFDTKTITLNGANITVNSDTKEDYIIVLEVDGAKMLTAAGIYIADDSEWNIELVGGNTITVNNTYNATDRNGSDMGIAAGMFILDELNVKSSSGTATGSLSIIINDSADGFKYCAGINSDSLALTKQDKRYNCRVQVICMRQYFCFFLKNLLTNRSNGVKL